MKNSAKLAIIYINISTGAIWKKMLDLVRDSRIITKSSFNFYYSALRYRIGRLLTNTILITGTELHLSEYRIV